MTGTLTADHVSALPAPPPRPVVVAHRGASGYRPEHTLASYALAVEMGADYLEPDLVPTRDGVLVARHESEIGGTTDVSRRPEFAHRRTSRRIDGRLVRGWFTEDFTLAELKTLRAVERLPDLRPGNTVYDGRFEIPTFEEVLTLAVTASRRHGRPIGVYPETKNPSYFAARGLALEDRMLAALRRHGLDRPGSPVFIQSFEVGNLRRLAMRTTLPLVQLVDRAGAPADADPGGPTYADLISPRGLAGIREYAAAIGVHQSLVLPRSPETGELGAPTTLVADAHRAGLQVHVWTLREDADPAAFWAAGVDGVFSDLPDTAVRARHSCGISAQATR